jgi:hypothetical protein
LFCDFKWARSTDEYNITGSRSPWQVAGIEDIEHPAYWQWVRELEKDKNESLWGTFNGASERLAEMMADTQDRESCRRDIA